MAGQHDDARMCLSVALTAAKLGAAVTNYTEVTELIKTSDGIVAGANVRDGMTGKREQLDDGFDQAFICSVCLTLLMSISAISALLCLVQFHTVPCNEFDMIMSP